MYQFLLNMWIMKRIDEEYLARMVTKGRITEEEKQMIMATPQVTWEGVFFMPSYKFDGGGIWKTYAKKSIRELMKG